MRGYVRKMVLGAVSLGMVLAGCMTSKQPLGQQARLALRAGEYGKAVNIFTSALTREGQQFELYLGRGKAYAAMGLTDKALADFDTALQIMPVKGEEVARERLPLLADKGRFEQLLVDTDVLLKRTPDHAEALYYKGRALEGLARYAEAADAYGQASATAPPGSPRALDVARRTMDCLLRTKEVSNYARARDVYLKDYLEPKQAAGLPLTDEDYLWAGNCYHVNLQDDLAKEMWGKMSEKARKEHGKLGE